MRGKLRHLIMIVPGVGGSILRDRATRAAIWDGTLGCALARLLDPEPLRLDDPDRVEAVGAISSTCITPFWTPIPGYDLLVGQLGNQFSSMPTVDWGDPESPRFDADILVFPYDFRRDVGDAAERLQEQMETRLAHRRAHDLPDRLIVIAHSLGGLVARYWLATSPYAVDRCEALLTLGTPHQGAPKALDVLVNGVRAGGVRVRRVREILQGWPSLYELLPRYRVVWDRRRNEAMRPGEVALAGLVPTLHQRAGRVHDVIEEAWSKGACNRVKMIPFVGLGQPTMQSFWWDGRSLTGQPQEPVWAYAGRPLGDGTVPEPASVPTELAGKGSEPRPVVCRHGWFLSLGEIGSTVRMITDPAQRLRGVPGPPQVHLGLDADELVPAGQPAQVSVTVSGPHAETARASGAAPRLRWRRVDRRTPWAPTSCRPHDDEWRATLPALDPGVYELELSAPERFGAGAHVVRELVGVIEREAMVRAL